MKTLNKLLGAAGVGMVAITMTLGGCGDDDSSNPVVVVPPAARTQMALALQTLVKDAATGMPLSPTAPDKVTLAIYGADANKVVNGDGVSIYNAASGLAGPLTASNGVFTIYVKPGAAVPAEMVLRLVASAKGFVNSSSEVVIKNTDLKTDGSTTAINVNIPLISQSAPPPSVVVVSTPMTLTGGTTAASATTIKTTESSATVNGAALSLGTTTVVIPATTKVYADANKTIALPAGSTEATVSYNNNTTTASLAAFPGGLTTRQDTTGAALASPGTFISGGFASIELKSTAPDGTVTKAKTFDKPVSVTISIPKSTINPQTGVAVKAGDVIPVWSYDTTTGAWSVQKLANGTVITGTLGTLDTSNNTFPVTFLTDHLSYFNLDWMFISSRNETCNTAPITIKGARGKRIFMQVTRVGGGWEHNWWLDAGSADPASNEIEFAPKNLPMRVDAYLTDAYDSGTSTVDQTLKVGTVTVNDLCGGVTLDVTAGVNQLSPLIKTADVSVVAREVCSNDATKATLVASDGVVAASSGQPTVSATTGTNGGASLKALTVGKTYQITVTNRNSTSKSVSYQVVDGTNATQTVDFPVTCTVVSGSGS